MALSRSGERDANYELAEDSQAFVARFETVSSPSLTVAIVRHGDARAQCSRLSCTVDELALVVQCGLDCVKVARLHSYM